MTSSVAELRTAGVTWDASDAVAITLQLIGALLDHDGADEVEPPYGPPSMDNVFLKEDGSVVCRGCRATPAVSEVGVFLDSLLHEGSGRVPGGLRYTIARALLDVDAPPFDSLHDFARDLVRHEHGVRAVLVRGVLGRAGAPPVSTAASLIDRRRPYASASELRRALREAEQRWYEHRPQMTPARVIDLHPPALPPRDRTTTAAAACLAAGLALLCTGEFMHRRQPVVAPTAPLVAYPVPADAPRVEPERGIIVVRDVPSSPTRVWRPDVRRASVKRARAQQRSANAVRWQPASRSVGRAGGRPFDQAQGRPSSRGVLDRLRLGWLRTAFVVRSDF